MDKEVACEGSDAGMEQEDYFTKLPRDCLIHIFSFVDRDTMDQVECLSKSIHDVVNEPSLKKIKKRGQLVIYERMSGHTVCMKSADHRLSFFQGSETGQGVPKGVRERIESQYCSQYSRGWPPGMLEPGESTVVPSSILDNMEELLEKHTAYHTSFVWIRMDNMLLERCAESLSGTAMDKLVFNEVVFDDALDLAKLSDFLLSVNLKHLDIRLRKQVLPTNLANFLRIFDEKFLSNFKVEIPDARPSFKLFLRGNTIYSMPYLWTPSREMLAVIARFEVLELDSLRLDTEALVQLILLRFEMEKNKSEWAFTLVGDEETVVEHFNKIDTRKFSVKVSLERDDLTEEATVIRKINSHFRCHVVFGDVDTSIWAVRVYFYEYEEM